ncbi:oxidoreductase [Nocardia panacis]|uniref:Oxidoreductase n=1 Tax=Nocardia panacis TaxID=2340916 RepID=A0A3A4KZP9_9NOCA|nr:GMC family oxidoreductase N-terminal domain-containing protein [Nocardia panacis]RJO79424.1 oxidoreductase [Nocardia panacis]
MTDDDLHADYVIVGAGTAGAVLARRLIERTEATVLVLEAGGSDRDPVIRDPARMHELWHTAADWDYYTVPQPHAAGRCLHMPRGRVLGGSHSLNATIYVRGNPADYDEWAALGNPGWSWQEVEPVFRRIERYDRPAAHRGDSGILPVLSVFEPDPIQRAIMAAAEQTGIPVNPDYNGPTQEGISTVQLTIHDGERVTTADAYLTPALDNPRLTLRTDALVHRLVVRDGRATGVTGVLAGQSFTAVADEAVLLTAGAIDSAALLLRSGIGPAEELRASGIAPVLNLPGVGRDLTDHWLVPVIFAAERNIVHTPGLPPAQTHLFWHSESGLAVPDLQPLHFSSPLYEPWMSGPANGFSLMAGLVRPSSVGTLTVAGPDGPTGIDPNVLAEPRDVRRLAAAVRLCQEIGAAPALRKWGAVQRYPGPGVGENLSGYIRRTVLTYHHAAGTCRMGTDPGAVVDPELRVRGIDGLRVADASIMPRITTGNTNAPTILIAERAADLIAP